jgi:hypothetical protein
MNPRALAGGVRIAVLTSAVSDAGDLVETNLM